MFRLAFWRAALERAVRSSAASMASLATAGQAGLLDADWMNLLSVSGMAGVVSLLFSISAGAVEPNSGPSFGTEVPAGNVVALRDSKAQEAIAGPAMDGVSVGTPVDVDVAADLVRRSQPPTGR